MRRALIVAPHADDEAIGACGLIRRLRRHGADVRVLVVTDGTASHRGSRQWPPGRLAAERRTECRRAMRRLGLSADRIRFLGLPDSGLHALRPPERQRIVQAMVAARPDLLVLPRPDDHHSDHQAIAQLASGLFLRSRRLAYLVWPGSGAAPHGIARTLPIRGQIAFKRSLIDGYRSQRGLIRDDPDGFEIDGALLARFAGPAEHFVELA